MATGRGNRAKISPVLTTSCLWGRGTPKSNTISRDNLFGKGSWGLVQGRGENRQEGYLMGGWEKSLHRPPSRWEGKTLGIKHREGDTDMGPLM